MFFRNLNKPRLSPITVKQTPDMEFKPLTPEEITGIDPMTKLPNRVNYQTKHVISAFVRKKDALREVKAQKEKIGNIQELHDELSTVPEPNRPEDWINEMSEATKELSKAQMALEDAQAQLKMEEAIINAVRRELQFINEMHPSAWHTTQALLDTIEMGINRPFHPLWK